MARVDRFVAADASSRSAGADAGICPVLAAPFDADLYAYRIGEAKTQAAAPA